KKEETPHKPACPNMPPHNSPHRHYTIPQANHLASCSLIPLPKYPSSNVAIAANPSLNIFGTSALLVPCHTRTIRTEGFALRNSPLSFTIADDDSASNRFINSRRSGNVCDFSFNSYFDLNASSLIRRST